MVTFNTYVRLAHQVAREKGLEVDDPRQFMRDLGTVYTRENHSEATESAAKNYLQQVVQ